MFNSSPFEMFFRREGALVNAAWYGIVTGTPSTATVFEVFYRPPGG